MSSFNKANAFTAKEVVAMVAATHDVREIPRVDRQNPASIYAIYEDASSGEIIERVFKGDDLLIFVEDAASPPGSHTNVVDGFADTFGALSPVSEVPSTIAVEPFELDFEMEGLHGDIDDVDDDADSTVTGTDIAESVPVVCMNGDDTVDDTP
jgi:hypothetical protein